MTPPPALNQARRTRRYAACSLLCALAWTGSSPAVAGRSGARRVHVDRHALPELPTGWESAAAAAPELALPGVTFLEGDVFASRLTIPLGATVVVGGAARLLVAGDVDVAGTLAASAGDVVIASGAALRVSGIVSAADGAVGARGGSVVLLAGAALTVVGEVRAGRGGDATSLTATGAGSARVRGADGGAAGRIVLAAPLVHLADDGSIARIGVRRGGDGADVTVVGGTGERAHAIGGRGGLASVLAVRADVLETGGFALRDLVRSPDLRGALGGNATARGGVGHTGSGGAARCGARGKPGRSGRPGGSAVALAGLDGGGVSIDAAEFSRSRARAAADASDVLVGRGGAATAIGGAGGPGGDGGDGASPGRGGRGGRGGRALATGADVTAAGGRGGDGGAGGDGCGRDGAPGVAGGRGGVGGRATTRPAGPDAGAALSEPGNAGSDGAAGAAAPFAAPRGLMAWIDVTPVSPRVGEPVSVVVRLMADGVAPTDVRVEILIDDAPAGDATLGRVDPQATAAFPVVFERYGRRRLRVRVDGVDLVTRRLRVRR